MHNIVGFTCFKSQGDGLLANGNKPILSIDKNFILLYRTFVPFFLIDWIKYNSGGLQII